MNTAASDNEEMTMAKKNLSTVYKNDRIKELSALMEEAMHTLLNVDAHMTSERVPVAKKLAEAIGHRWPPYEACESCDEPATKHDATGLPLCEICYDECVAETRALNLAAKFETP